ncbi:MAG: serine/threonine protein kinase/WD40 repeat protein [Planctomycetota bacterium]|jgi:serine/threonine protein kinase/WD40 repeat protein
MLNDSQRERLQGLFAEGVQLAVEERAAFVARAGGDDPAVQRELSELLQVEAARLQDFLDEPAIALPDAAKRDLYLPSSTAETPSQATERALPEIDGYDQFELIADGGMGTVFKAQQLRPLRRTVAIKIIRFGMDSDSVLARFEAERQALAMMSHPYIAAVYDAGTDAMGRPFLAMEYVAGLPLAEFCASEQLSFQGCLELFVKVCNAIDHAHRRGVLHRDLKPSNVLVCDSDGTVVPKVIDFGIAKALQGQIGDHSIHTVQGSFLGTPEYMSPEQLEGANDRIDTRSDVYSLGVMLYELMARARPVEPERFRDVGIAELTRIARDEVPPKPSTRFRQMLTTRAERSPQLDEQTQWLRRLQGDLDWIVMKALEKDPDRRYRSPRELAADIEDFLAHRPVTAGPPSSFYLARKFARRHRGLVIGTACTTLALVIGLASAIKFALDAKQQSALATQRQLVSERSELRLAGAQLTSAWMAMREHRPARAADLLRLVPWQRLGFEWGMLLASAPKSLPCSQSSLDQARFVESGASRCIVSLLDGRLRAWDMRGAPLANPMPDREVIRFGDSPGSSVLVVATRRGEVFTLDLSSGARVPWQSPTEDLPKLVAVSSDGRSVAWIDDRALHVGANGKPTTTTQLDTIHPGFDRTHWLAFVGTTEILVIAAVRDGDEPWSIRWRQRIVTWDVAENAPLASRELDSSVMTYAVDSRGPALILSAQHEFIRCDARTLATTGKFPVPAGVLSSLAFSGNGARFAATSKSTGVHIYDTRNQALLMVLDDGIPLTSDDGGDVMLSSDGRHALITGPLQRNTLLIDVARVRGAPLRALTGHTSFVYQLAISNDGSVIASSAPLDPHVRLWDACTGALLARLSRGAETVNFCGHLVFDATDRQLVATASRSNGGFALHRWDLATGVHTATPLSTAPEDEATLAAVCEAAAMSVRTQPTSLNSRVVYLPGARTFAAISGSGRQGAPFRLVTAEPEASSWQRKITNRTCVAVDRESRWIATGHALGVEIFDAATGSLVSDVPQLRTLPQCLAFSPDGTRLAIGCNDGRVVLLETDYFEVVLQFAAVDAPTPQPPRDRPSAYVNALVWTPDGSSLITAGGDGVLRVWSTWEAEQCAEVAALHARQLQHAGDRLREQLTATTDPGTAVDALLAARDLSASERAAIRIAAITRWADATRGKDEVK